MQWRSVGGAREGPCPPRSEAWGGGHGGAQKSLLQSDCPPDPLLSPSFALNFCTMF